MAAPSVFSSKIFGESCTWSSANEAYGKVLAAFVKNGHNGWNRFWLTGRLVREINSRTRGPGFSATCADGRSIEAFPIFLSEHSLPRQCKEALNTGEYEWHVYHDWEMFKAPPIAFDEFIVKCDTSTVEEAFEHLRRACGS